MSWHDDDDDDDDDDEIVLSIAIKHKQLILTSDYCLFTDKYSNISVLPTDGTLSDTTKMVQIEPRINGNEGVPCIL